MKAVQFESHGEPSVLSYDDHPDPEIGPKEVLVDVQAGSVNYLDIWARRGEHGMQLPKPHIPGSDVAGIVRDVGDNVTRFDPGDHVAVYAIKFCGDCEFCRRGEPTMCVDYHVIGAHTTGVHAELAAVHEDNLIPIPEHVEWSIAAAAPMVFLTAWRLLMTRGRVSAGEDVLVLGASGGVGHAAVQIADSIGATVYATASTDKKLAHAKELGAEYTINYTNTDFADRVRDLTNKRGVDVVVDHVGAATFQDSLRALANGGRLLTCGVTTGAVTKVDINRLFYNELQIIGSTMATPGEADDVLDLVWEGTLEPTIRTELPMSRAEEAHEIMENRGGFGKIIVHPDAEH